MYPRIRVSGDARERGRQYGEQAQERIARSLAAYREVFAQEAGWEWERVRSEAAAFRAPIAAHGAKYMEEIEGIAEGAGVDVLDVLAINVRTEVMFAAKARRAAATGAARPSLPLECSALAVLPERTVDGRLLVAQNWDWLVHSFETVVVLEAEQDDGPDYVTVVEAGLLAKTGINSAGVALATNALVSAADRGEPGVPYHVRAALDPRRRDRQRRPRRDRPLAALLLGQLPDRRRRRRRGRRRGRARRRLARLPRLPRGRRRAARQPLHLGRRAACATCRCGRCRTAPSGWRGCGS